MEILIRKHNILPAYILYLLVCIISSYFFYIWGLKINLENIVDESTRGQVGYAANFGIASIFFYGAMSANDTKYHPDKFTTIQFIKDILSISINSLLLGGALAFIMAWAIFIVGILGGAIIGIILIVIIMVLSFVLGNNMFEIINILSTIAYIIVIVLNVHCFQAMFSREENKDN